MAVGRPIKLTPNVARKTISITATAGQTTFTPTGGYRIGDLAVYRNGVRLVNGRDFTAVDGANVILQSGATLDDVLEFGIFDSFNIADAVPANGDATISGNLTVGLTTVYNTAGIVSSTYFYGDGSNLTGVANTGYINAVSVNASGIITANSFEGSGANLTGVSGFGTALSNTSGDLLNLVYKTPRDFVMSGVASVYINSDTTSGDIAFTRLGAITVGGASTLHIGAGTTLVMDVLNIF